MPTIPTERTEHLSQPPVGPSKLKWFMRRWVQLVVVGVIGLGLGGIGGSSSASSLQTKLDAAQKRDASLVASANTDRDNAITSASVASAEQRAKDDAQVSLKSQQAALETQKTAVANREKAVANREKAVSGAEATAAANTIPGDGDLVVGQDIRAGTYKSAGGEHCYWARHNKANDILDNHLGSGPTVMVVHATDFSVEINGCGEFKKTA